MTIYKRTFALVISILTVCTAFFTVSSVNATGATIINNVQISNGSFDKTTITTFWDGVTPNNWKQQSTNYTYQIQAEQDGFDGNYLILYNDPSNDQKNTFIFTTEKYLTITENVPYKFGVKFLANDLDASNCFVTVTVYDATSAKINTYQGQTTFATDICEWTDVSVSVPVTEGATSAKLTVTAYVKTDCGIDYAYGVTNILSTDTGASIRLAQDTPGLRFTAKVDKTFFDNYSKNYGAEVGMIITPIDHVQTAGEFTVDALVLAGKTYLEIDAKQWNNVATVDLDGYYGFSCAIVNIKEGNVKREFCARSYLKYTLGGNTVYIYGDYNYINHARSIYGVANKAIEVIEEYDELEQRIITAYANGQIPVFE
ncbi:MAG: hypothetical protein IJV95_00190 [Clostridia bacterium]|nr:hypothetical protein [Clostridia bacterium]